MAETRRELHDRALIDALDRLRVTRLGHVIEAEVRGNDRTSYRVRVDGQSWACSCPAAIYAGRRGKACKHTQALRIIRRTLPLTFGGAA